MPYPESLEASIRAVVVEHDTFRVVGYCRASTTEQQNTLITQQQEQARWAASMSKELVHCFTDSGTSGSSSFLERPVVIEMLAAMTEHGIHHIVFTKLDRAFRNVVDCCNTIVALEKRGISFTILQFGGMTVDSQTAMGRMMLQIAAVFAEFELSVRRERQTSALDLMRSTRQKIGPGRYGWDPDPSRPRRARHGESCYYLPNPTEQSYLRLMCQWYVELKDRHTPQYCHSLIATRLNDLGVKPKAAGKVRHWKGKPIVTSDKWTDTKVASVLKHACLASEEELAALT